MIEISKDDCRILIEGLDCYLESISAGNYEETEGDDSEKISILKSVLQEYMDQK